MKNIKYYQLLILLIALAFFAQTQFVCDSQRYQSFLISFNLKKATDIDQYNNRLNIYCQNLKKIEEVNSKNLEYTLKQYRWMDKSDQQLKKLIKVQISTVSLLSSSLGLNENVKKVSTVAAASIDWRATNDVSSIKDQGSCGCCWSFTVVGLYQSWMMSKGQEQLDLSQQYILQCTTSYTKQVFKSSVVSSCDGGVVDYAGDLLRRNGAPLENQYPYLGYSYVGADTPITIGICQANQTRIFAGNPSVTNFEVYRNLTTNGMKQLITQSPVGALIYADDGFSSYATGIYGGCPTNFITSYQNINHAVVIVGYDSNGNYIIKNSWGTSWGNNGFGVISATKDCGLSAFVYKYSSTSAAGSSLIYNNPLKLNRTADDKSLTLCLLFLIMYFATI